MNLDGIPTLTPRISNTTGPSLTSAVADALGIIQGAQNSLTVLINDPQRHTDSNSVLREIQTQSNFRKTRVLIATGTHQFDAGVRSDFEQRVLQGVKYDEVQWHDCRSKELRPLGGWRLHPWLLDGEQNGDAILTVGSVEPHYFAGFTGAHKTCTIGCAGYESIEANHAGALSPDSRPGRLDGNPVHDGIAAAVALLTERQKIAAVNIVQVGEKIAGAFGGEVLASLNAAAELASECFIRQIEAPLDAIILDESGPLGETFYQADKCIKNTEHAVRNGGAIILNAACQGGVGQDHFVSLLREAKTHGEAMKIVEKRGYKLGDHKAVRLRNLTDPATRNVKLFIISKAISDSEAELLGAKKAATISEALNEVGMSPANHDMLRLRGAGNTILKPLSQRP